MSIDSTWLRCPNCFEDLEPVGDGVYGCARGHRFDRSKHGHLTLLPPHAPRTLGDDRSMLSARAALLDGGAFEPIAAAVVEAVRTTAIEREPDTQPRVADLGCGTGYYSLRLSQAIGELEFLLADRSPDAVRMSRRALGDATGVVLDIWRPLPIRDAVADVVLNVFAPRNASEFARILRPSGCVVTVVPTPAHLAELRADGTMLDVPADKVELVKRRFADAGFERRSRTTVEYRLDAPAPTRAQLVGMGPAAHHAAGRPIGDDDAAPELTVSVDVLAFATSGRQRAKFPR